MTRLIIFVLAMIPVSIIGTALYARTIYYACLALDFDVPTSMLLSGLTVAITVTAFYWTAAYRAIEGKWWWA